MIILTEVNKNNHYFNNYYDVDTEFINVFNKYKNFIISTQWYAYLIEYIKFKNYYIRNIYYNELRVIYYLNYLGQLHREDGPAEIWYDENGQINEEKYFLNNKRCS